MRFLLTVLLFILIPATGFAQQASNENASRFRASVDLSGEWEFRIDPADVGRTESWFTQDKEFERTIKVPAAWNTEGVSFPNEEQLRAYEKTSLKGRQISGPAAESEKLKHVYPGPAWYRKKTTIPAAWKGKPSSLVLHGVHREAEVWINGRAAGMHRSYLTPFQIDLAPFGAAGDPITIVVRVDARHNPDEDPLMGCLDTLDFLHVNWGGLHRKVTLEAVNPVHIDDLFVVPRLNPLEAEVNIALNTQQAAGAGAIVEITDAAGSLVATVKQPIRIEAGQTTCVLALPEAKLWSPKEPHLYTATVRLILPDGEVDRRSVRFGMRELKIANGGFLLNGQPIFLRGYGDDCIFPNTISPPTDKDEFRRRLSIARSYGFNYVRHHSWCPPEEYFDAADELGMMIQPEFPFAYRTFLPTTTKARRSAVEQWKQMIRLHRNHPSIVTWCMGNELYGSFDDASEMYEAAKSLDPTRLVLNSDGCSFDENSRTTLDFLVVPFAEDNSIGFNDGKYTIPKSVTKPVIAHEIGYFVTLPDLEQLRLFQNGLRPYWLFETRENATRRGVLDQYPEWLKASCKLQSICLKTNLEAARRSNLSGTSVWLLQDYPNCAEGVVDMFLRPKGVSAEEFRRYNSPTVLLLDAPRRNWWAGETADLKLLVSRFEDDPSTGAVLKWELAASKQDRVSSGEVLVNVGNNGVQDLHAFKLDLPEIETAQRMTLSCRLKEEQRVWENSWNFWIFPRDVQAQTAKKVAFSSGTASLRAIFAGSSEETTGSHETDLLITTVLGDDTIDYLEQGGRVLLVDPEAPFRIEKTNFRLSSWDGGGPSGTIIDTKHPAFRKIPSDGWCDLQFYHLIQGSKTIFLDQLSPKIVPIVRCIDRPNRLADRAYLFEVAVGKGKLLVSGFNFAGAGGSKDPAGTFVFNRLIQYALSNEFKPNATLSEGAGKAK